MTAPPRIELATNPDILATLAAPGPNRPRLVVGFAAETEKVVEHADGQAPEEAMRLDSCQ